MSKILITGGAGYIGSHTVHLLISKGIKPEQIIVFDNLCHGHRASLPEGVTFVEGDLLDKQSIASVFSEYSIVSVLHFAAFCYVGESMENPGKYFVNNITGGVNLLDSMAAHDCQKIVFSSTCATFGLSDDEPITELSPRHPINPYGESKLIFERILDWYDHIYDIKSVSLRYFNAAGAGFGIGELHEPETHLIPLVIQTALGQREYLEIFGTDYDTEDGTCVRDYVHVIDLAEAHFMALNYLNHNQNSLGVNLGTGCGVSVRRIVDIVRVISGGRNIRIIESSRRAGDPTTLVADNIRAKEVLGWHPTRDIHEIIQSAWNWHCGLVKS